jgi:hypothetical protein
MVALRRKDTSEPRLPSILPDRPSRRTGKHATTRVFASRLHNCTSFCTDANSSYFSVSALAFMRASDL